jgi:FkbM family methyltransferase
MSSRPAVIGLARRLARKTINALRDIRGERFDLDGRSMRFLSNVAPPEFEPSSDDHVQYADYWASRAFFRAISEGDWVADVGAFRGTYTVLAAAAAGPTGRVTAFEPFPESRQLIARSVAKNGIEDRVVIAPYAVLDRTGQVNFFTAGVRNENSVYKTAVPSQATPVIVSCVTLDGYFDREGRLPAVVKVDVEGAEFAVLRGAERILASGARVFCEFHPYAWEEAGHNAEDFFAWLATRGRRIVDVRPVPPSGASTGYGVYELQRI